MNKTDKIEPIAVVINNNQNRWENIIETKPNVTLSIGKKLYDEQALTTHGQEMYEKGRVSAFDEIKKEMEKVDNVIIFGGLKQD